MDTRGGRRSLTGSPEAGRGTAVTTPEALLVASQQRGGRGRHRRVTRRRAALVSGMVCVLGLAGLALAARPATSRADTVANTSGYAVSGGSYFSVTADFTVPTPNCPGLPGAASTDYWVGLQNQGQNIIVQTGFSVQCNGVDSAWTTSGTTGTLQGGFSDLPNPVQTGDFIELGVSCSGSTCYEAIVDATQGNWVADVPISVPGFTADTALVAGESFNGGALSSPVAVTNAQVNIQPIGQSNPQPLIEDPSDYQGTSQLVPGPLDPTGQDFDFSWSST